MHARRVLVIDDEQDFIDLIKVQLENAGAVVDAALSAEEGLRLFRDRHHDLVLLDVMMPGIDGWQACQAFRELSGVPIIMLTAMSSDMEVVRGLECGADDYLVKPFNRQVLLARMRAVLRRAETSSGRWGPMRYQDDHLAFDLAQRQISVQGQPVNLTPTEYYLFECMVCNADHLLTPQQILECVWGPEYVDSIEYVHVYMHRLRRKLEPDPQNPRYLMNVTGVGYLFRRSDTPSERS